MPLPVMYTFAVVGILRRLIEWSADRLMWALEHPCEALEETRKDLVLAQHILEVRKQIGARPRFIRRAQRIVNRLARRVARLERRCKRLAQ